MQNGELSRRVPQASSVDDYEDDFDPVDDEYEGELETGSRGPGIAAAAAIDGAMDVGMKRQGPTKHMATLDGSRDSKVPTMNEAHTVPMPAT
eukprot:scaffold221639_cov16-Prasinocladus_malaysianus.AAC.1